MKTLRQILEVYSPKSADEKRFVNKHIVVKTPDVAGNGDDVYSGKNVKEIDRKTTRKGYNTKDSESVYEEYDVILVDEERTSTSYQFTHKPGDSESEKRLADLKAKHKGTNQRVVMKGRLGKNNPNAKKYSYGYPKNIAKADAAHHDVYVYDKPKKMKEEVELDEGTYKPDVERAFPASGVKTISPKKAPYDKEKTAKAIGAAMDKAHDAVQKGRAERAAARAIAMAKYGVKMKKEEIDQIDELSKGTLTRYKTKASNQAHSAKSELDNLKHSPDGGDRAIARDAGKTYVKRTMGAAQAGRKLNYGKYTREEVEQMDEVLKVSSGAGAWIKDFQDSDNPKFAGKSKEQRKQQALAAFYAAKRSGKE